MSDLSKLTAKDEREDVVNLQRENPIMTEVIVHLRDENAVLWATQVNLLEALIEAQDALRVYRLSALEVARRANERRCDCAFGCRKHEWHDADGWHQKGE